MFSCTMVLGGMSCTESDKCKTFQWWNVQRRYRNVIVLSKLDFSVVQKVAICTCPAPRLSIFSECAVMLYYVDQSPDNAAEIIACVTDVNSEIAIPLVDDGRVSA